MASSVTTAPRAQVRATRGRAAPRAHLNVFRSGVTWIVVLATLLAGLVAVNVAVLQLNVRLDRLDRERATLRSDNAALESQLSSMGAAPRIESLARTKLGLVYAGASATHYVELGK